MELEPELAVERGRVETFNALDGLVVNQGPVAGECCAPHVAVDLREPLVHLPAAAARPSAVNNHHLTWMCLLPREARARKRSQSVAIECAARADAPAPAAAVLLMMMTMISVIVVVMVERVMVMALVVMAVVKVKRQLVFLLLISTLCACRV